MMGEEKKCQQSLGFCRGGGRVWGGTEGRIGITVEDAEVDGSTIFLARNIFFGADWGREKGTVVNITCLMSQGTMQMELSSRQVWSKVADLG